MEENVIYGDHEVVRVPLKHIPDVNVEGAAIIFHYHAIFFQALRVGPQTLAQMAVRDALINKIAQATDALRLPQSDGAEEFPLFLTELQDVLESAEESMPVDLDGRVEMGGRVADALNTFQRVLMSDTADGFVDLTLAEWNLLQQQVQSFEFNAVYAGARQLEKDLAEVQHI